MKVKTEILPDDTIPRRCIFTFVPETKKDQIALSCLEALALGPRGGELMLLDPVFFDGNTRGFLMKAK